MRYLTRQSPHSYPVILALRGINLYQRTVSPDHGPLGALVGTLRCRFFPSCSQYGVDALQRHGLIRGTLRTMRRVGRCHPWSRGGYDPVSPTDTDC